MFYIPTVDSMFVVLVFLIKISLTNVVCSSHVLRIIGGRDVRPDELPYVVAIELLLTTSKHQGAMRVLRQQHCTASVIKPTWSITAAHCDPYMAKKMMGFFILNPESVSAVVTYGTPVSVNISRIISFVRHPRLALQSEQVFDVALLKTEPIHLQTYGRISAVEVISLYGQEMLVAGHGNTNSSDNEVLPALNLHKPLQVVKGMLKKCGFDETIAPLPNVCIVPKCRERPTVCGGDSGGPVIHSTGIIAINSMAFVPLNCQMKTDRIRYPNIVLAKPLSLMIDWLSDIVTDD